jgi:hypothetical protein
MGQYRTGTVTVTANSATVFGSGTTWTSSGIQPGHWFTIRDEGITYTVAAVLGEDQLVLTGAYQGQTRAGAFYLLHTDFTPRGYAVPGPGDVDATVIVRRAIYDIDADMTRSVGASQGGGGSGGSITMASISDLSSSTALTGQVLTKLSDGTFGFTSAGSIGVSIVNMASQATGVGQIYAGTNAGGSHQFRAIHVVGASLTQNTETLTITVPSGGEVNTLASLASSQSVSIVAPKSGTTLNTYGLRGINGVTVVRDQNDVVISGSGTGGSGTGEANTGENLGAAGTNVVRVYSDKLGTSLRFRTILFNTEHFTVGGEITGQYTINLRRQRLADSPDADLSTAVAGQVLTRGSDAIWRGQPLPPSGITSLQADPAPRLGGDLVTGGRRIIGMAGTLSGMVEKPKAKNYTLILKAANQIAITSIAATCGSGSVSFALFTGDPETDTPEDTVPTVSGTANSVGISESIAADALQVTVGSRLTLRLVPESASVGDFSFSISCTSA